MNTERPHEVQAATAIGRALKRTLRRFEDEKGDDSLDYIDDVGDVYEMKAVVPTESMQLHAARRDPFESKRLSMQWLVLLAAPSMADKFRELPNFPPDPDSREVAAIEADGMNLVTRSEREAEWRARFSGTLISVPRIGRRELLSLEAHFLVLETGGHRSTRGAHPRTREEVSALGGIRQITHDAICMAHEPPHGELGGIEILVGTGLTRTGDPNNFVFRVQSWLDSPLGENLKQSLKQLGYPKRHAVLTFDQSEPEYWSAQEEGLAFVPTNPLDLPDWIDSVWCLIGSLILRYDNHGWRSFKADS